MSEMLLVERVAIGLSVALGASGCAAMRDAQMDPEVREALGEGAPIRVLHSAPRPIDYVRSAFERRDTFHGVPGAEDPVVETERAFLDALRDEMGVSHLRHPEALRLELETLAWQIDGSGLKRIVGRCTLLFGLRARLVRYADDPDLWRAFCRFEQRRPCSEFVADGLKVVKELRPEIAKRCTAELTGSFMGRSRSTL